MSADKNVTDLCCSGVADAQSTLKCMEANGHIDVARIEACINYLDSEGRVSSKTLRALFVSTLKRWKKMEQASLPSPTDKTTWSKLGPEEQWTLFSSIEMDVIGWERRVRQLKEELARQAAEHKTFRDRIDREDEHRLKVENEQREDNWKTTNANRVLRKQIEELGHIPKA